MDSISDRFAAIPWRYAPHNLTTLVAIERCIAAKARVGKSLTYSDVADGIAFSLPTPRAPMLRIDVRRWRSLDRLVVGEILAYVSMRSFAQGKFFPSAVVVRKGRQPTSGPGFHNPVCTLGRLPGKRETPRAVQSWRDQLDRTCEWYTQH